MCDARSPEITGHVLPAASPTCHAVAGAPPQMREGPRAPVGLTAHAREQLASLARTTQAREEAALLRRRLMASESTTCLLVVHAELHVPLLQL